jgi:hypothetical protein
MPRLLVAFSLIALLSTSCAPRKRIVTETRTSLTKWMDTTTLIHVGRTELVALETIRYHHADTNKMITRKVVIRQQQTDTTARASLALRSNFTADTTQTTQLPPLMVESKKKGQAWLCPLVLVGCVIFFTIIYCKIHNIRK